MGNQPKTRQRRRAAASTKKKTSGKSTRSKPRTTSPGKRKPARADTGSTPPGRPAGLLAGLGMVGMEAIEPVILAALISGEPLLLIGRHGTAKSYLLARIAEALRLEWRHYNASLLNYDDLVGYPLPDVDGNLKFIETPASIWGAQAVFFDEISRCRIDLQNKLFPIIHERRVQGIELSDLVFRWAAMNPPGDGTGDQDYDAYLGSLPLDTALADRFAFIVETPGWEQLTEEQRREVVCVSQQPLDPAVAERLCQLVDSGRSLLPGILDDSLVQLAEYVQVVNDLLRAARSADGDTTGDSPGARAIELSPRRAGMLARNIAAVHVASLLLESKPGLRDSARIALEHSIPQRAQGIDVPRMRLLAAHREAWDLAELEPFDPRRYLATEQDPVRRAVTAARLGCLNRSEFSAIVADSLASLPLGGRHALAAWLFENDLAGRLVAAIAEQCGELFSLVVTPQSVNLRVHSRSVQHTAWQHITRRLAKLDRKDRDRQFITNLLVGLFALDELARPEDVTATVSSWCTIRRQLKGEQLKGEKA